MKNLIVVWQQGRIKKKNFYFQIFVYSMEVHIFGNMNRALQQFVNSVEKHLILVT